MLYGAPTRVNKLWRQPCRLHVCVLWQATRLPLQLRLPQDGLVKLVPVVEIVQVHGIFERGRVIRNAARAADAFARFVVVIVTTDRGVVFLDR